MKDGLNVAVVGATGMVGEAMLEMLAEGQFPVASLQPLASERSLGKTVTYKGRAVPCEVLAEHDFSTTDLALFSAGGAISAEFAPRAAAAGCIVVDNTSQFRLEDDIPLVVPEVNGADLAGYTQRNIIANPNCSTIQMLAALKPLYDAVGIERINVATYQAVSGAGRSAVERLARQTATLLNGQPLPDEGAEKQIAFNAIPHIDAFQDNGYTREEMKMVWETRKIFGDEAILVNPTAVRIPAFIGHSEAIHIETREPIEVEQARALLEAAPGVEVLSEARVGGYPTAVTEGAGKDAVYVGRLRRDISHPRGLNLWVVSDNVRKGAALNSVQIAEILVREYL